MDVWFDTEFTTLDPRVGYPGLISIGCVAENGSEFYAELTDTWHPANCSDFVLQTVVPLLWGPEWQMSEAECAIRLKAWVEGMTEEQVIFRSDSPRFDWAWLEQLFTFHGAWPANLRRRCGVMSFDHEKMEPTFDSALAEFWRTPDHAAWRHHALIDARSLMFAWRRAHASA